MSAHAAFLSALAGSAIGVLVGEFVLVPFIRRAPELFLRLLERL